MYDVSVSFCCADFDYSTTTAKLQSGIELPGSVHQGFARVAASLWQGGLSAALQSLSSSTKITNVYVAGHSLGAGVSTLVSYGVQVTYVQLCCCMIPCSCHRDLRRAVACLLL
jgi:esterase/lipase